MADKKEYIEVEGIQCEVKDPSRRATVLYYQETLKKEIDKYIGSVTVWTDSKKGYRDALNINVKIAPFVLGWLRRPEDRDEYNVITGRLTLEELEAKRKKEASGKKPTKRRTTRKKSDSTAKKQDTTQKTAASKKPTATKKAAPKKTTSKTTRKKS